MLDMLTKDIEDDSDPVQKELPMQPKIDSLRRAMMLQGVGQSTGEMADKGRAIILAMQRLKKE